MNAALKSIIGDIDLTSYTYMEVLFDKGSGPGLADQTFQLKMYLKIAYELGLILILPKRNLAMKHNNGVSIPLIFSDYYDINSIKVSGNSVDVVTSIPDHQPDIGLEPCYDLTLQIDALVRPFPDLDLDYEVTIEPCTTHMKFAREFVDSNKISGCVHIRRTDRCRGGHHVFGGISGPDWDIANRPKNIISMLDNTIAPGNIYIMTDMSSDDPIIEDLRKQKKYNFMFLYDFPELIEIKNENNYKVYSIESCIMAITSYKKHKGNVVKYYLQNK